MRCVLFVLLGFWGCVLGSANLSKIAIYGVEAFDSSRDVAQTIKAYAQSDVTIINIAKALERTSGKRISEVIPQGLDYFNYHYTVLTGGTTTDGFFHHEPLGVDIASVDKATRHALKELFKTSDLEVTTTPELLAVEYASEHIFHKDCSS